MKNIVKLGAAAATVALLAGCAGGAGDSGKANSSGEGGEKILTYLEPNTFTTLYPASAGYYPNGGVVNQITDRLLFQDPETFELSPWIATSLPEVNEDATEYTFDIRTDVTYSDGTPLTSENVVKNISLFALGDPERKLSPSEQISNFERGEVVDEDTVKFYFTAPAPGFAQAVSVYNAGLLSDATLDKTSEEFGPGNATTIIGSGPFVISDEKVGSELTLTAREDYDWAPPANKHQGRAQIDGIKYILAAEESVRIGALTSGQADVVREISAPKEKEVKASGAEMKSYSTGGMTNQLDFRFLHPLLSDIKVRQAIFAGIDREGIVKSLFTESYPLATSPVDSRSKAHVDVSKAYKYDPKQAEKLLDEAGWKLGSDGIREKDGAKLEITFNEALPQPRSKEVITKVQEQLGKIGIKVNIFAGDFAAQDEASKDINQVQIRHTMVGRADYDVIKSLYYSKNRNQLLNYNAATGEIGDPHLESLLEKISSSAAEEDRIAAAQEVQHYLTDNYYVLPLFEEPQVYGVQPYVKGFRGEAVARPWFYNVSIEK